MNALKKLPRAVINLAFSRGPRRLRVEWTRRAPDAWIAPNLGRDFVLPPDAPGAVKIQKIASQLDRLGPQTLWDGYRDVKGYKLEVVDATRVPGEVNTSRRVGNFFTYLVMKKKPQVVVEFGTAFGVSGMYWLAGLESNDRGEMLTFEPNESWAEIARKNLTAVGDRFRLVIGTFEDNIASCLDKDKRIDIAFIDAIHTSEFVWPQFNMLVDRMVRGGIVLLDDIYFSEDMTSCWRRIALDSRVRASAVLARHVGIVELM